MKSKLSPWAARSALAAWAMRFNSAVALAQATRDRRVHVAQLTSSWGGVTIFAARRGGGAAERAGLENRSPAGDGEDPTPATQKLSDDPVEVDVEALALCLRKDPVLAEVASVWKLLDEPIRQAILQLARVKASRS